MNSNDKLITKDVVLVLNKKTNQDNSEKNAFIFDTAGSIGAAIGTALISGASIVASPVAAVSFLGLSLGAKILASRGKGKTQELNKRIQDIQLVSPNDLQTAIELDGIKLRNVNSIAEGLVLVKHPFLPNTYINIDSMEEDLLNLKLDCLSSIMQDLGATSLKGHANLIEMKERTIDAKFRIEYKTIKIDPSVKKEQKEKYESSYIIEDSYNGEFNKESYIRAKEQAAKFGLDKDIAIQILMEQRNPDRPRKLMSRKRTIELTRELNKTLDIALPLSISGIALAPSYNGLFSSCKTIKFEFDVQF